MKYGILKKGFLYPITDGHVDSVFVAPISIVNNQPAYVQDTVNLRRKASLQGVQRWEITTNLAPTNDSAANLINSVMKNAVTPFLIRMPQVYGLKIPSTATTVNSAVRGSSTLNASSPLVPGEFINIGINNKVYLVTETNGNTATILPPLMTAILAVTALKRCGDVTMLVRQDSDTQLGITYVDGVLSDQGSIRLIEAI